MNEKTPAKRGLALAVAGALLATACLGYGIPSALADQSDGKVDDTYGTTYYLDSTIGKTDGDGLSPANAFDSLEDVNSMTFQPGDQILIKAGTQYTGTLWPKGSGCEGYPIVIDMYGEGDKPLIDGNGAYFMPQVKDWQGPFTGQNGDQIGAAVYLYNQEYIEINNLEVKNQGDNVNRDRSGIRVEGYDYGVIDHIYIRDCYVHDVRGYNGQDDIYPVVPTNPDGSPLDGYVGGDQSNPNTSNTFWGARTTHRTGGINFVTYTARLPEAPNSFNVRVQELDETKKITTFNDILIENNTVEDCQANGITTTNVKGTLDDVKFRHTNVVIRGNYIHNVTRSGIIPIYTNGVLVEYNKVDRFQSTTEGYGCGIWCDRSNGMVFQYNEVCNGVNGMDGMAFNLDDMTRDGLIQYNYTHDNYGGGYMLHVRQKSYNRNNTIRFNLSVNDSGVFTAHNAQIVAVGETSITKLESAKVYNNTFISNKDCHAVYQGDEVDYTNNIWYFTNPTVATRNQCFQPGANSTFNNNVYIGCVAPTSDENKHTENPQFVGGANLFGLDKNAAFVAASLMNTSPYVGAGVSVEGNGGKDILGSSLETLNLGAFAGAGHETAPTAQTYTVDNVTKYLANDTKQTEVINETPEEAATKWVNTTFGDQKVIYTKSDGAYLEFDMVGTGGTFTVKRGPGAGNVKVVAYQNGEEVASETVSTYSATADTATINDLASLSDTNKAYTIRFYCAEANKAANFISFTTNVAQETEAGCSSDGIAGVVVERPMAQTIPYGKDSVSLDMASHVYFRTCDATQKLQAEVTYAVEDENATVEGSTVTFTAAGTYTITARATYNNVTVTDSVTVKVTQGGQPQVNVPAVETRVLSSLISACDGLNLSKYNTLRQDVFQKVLAEAKALLETENYTQDQVNEMVDLLTAAKAGLSLTRAEAEDGVVVKNGNWVELSDGTLDGGKALKSGKANETMTLDFFGNEIHVVGRKAVGVAIMTFTVTRLSDNHEVYTQTVDGYSDSKQDQQELFAWTGDTNDQYRLTITNTGKKHAGATNPDINVIIDYLTMGVNESLVPNVTALAEALEQAAQLNQADYTAQQWAPVAQAITAARQVYVNATATQEQVEEVIVTLTQAMEALKPTPEPETYTVTVETQGEGTAAADPTTATADATVTLTQTAAEGWHFVAWQSETVTVAEDNTFVMPEGNVTITAVFEKDETTGPSEVSLKLLKAFYDEAAGEDYSNLIDTAKTYYEKALADAKAILDNPSAYTEADVDEATDRLMYAVGLLSFVKGDPTTLQMLVDRANEMKTNESKYVTTHWEQLETALAQAEALLEKVNNTLQDEMDQASDVLLTAILAQRFQADKSILEDLLKQAETVDLSNASPAAVAAFRTALDNAKVVMANATLSVEDQAQVDAAVSALSAAMDGLTAGGAPETTEKPEATEKPETTEKPEATQKPEATEKPEGVPQTGDTAQLLVYVVALGAAVMALGAVTVVRRRRS